jgi:hypothetical protein
MSLETVGSAQGTSIVGDELTKLLRAATALTLVTTLKVLTHRVHEYDAGLSRDGARAELYREQRSHVEAELLRRLGGPQATG